MSWPRLPGFFRDGARRATPYSNDKLAGGGAILTDQPGTVDSNIITGMGPGAALEFALTLAEQLGKGEIVDGLARKWRIKR